MKIVLINEDGKKTEKYEIMELNFETFDFARNKKWEELNFDDMDCLEVKIKGKLKEEK